MLMQTFAVTVSVMEYRYSALTVSSTGESSTGLPGASEDMRCSNGFANSGSKDIFSVSSSSALSEIFSSMMLLMTGT